MSWQELLLKDASARPYIPYNFLRDLPPDCLSRLDNILETHLGLDERKAVKMSHRNGGEVLCRYEGCLRVCANGNVRGQHERVIHGKAKSNGK